MQQMHAHPDHRQLEASMPRPTIKPIDRDRHHVVRQLCEEAKRQSAALVGFKVAAMSTVHEFLERSLMDYDVHRGGKKGNVTLVSADGRHKVERRVQDTISFDGRLQAAKALIDECIQNWSKDINANIRLLVNDAFRIDRQGRINTARVLALRRLEIADEKWQQAMQAIGDSMRIAGTKPYIRFYERDDATGEYTPIRLDVAAA